MKDVKTIAKTDEQRWSGMSDFLIPVEVMPESVEQSKDNAPRKLSCTGQVVTVGGQRFFKVDKWQKLF